MLRIMSEKLWSLMKKKDISLVMIFDNEGKILWSRGRKLGGNKRDLKTSYGFSKTAVRETLNAKKEVYMERGSYMIYEDILSGTAITMGLKSILTLPVSERMFVYFDSKNKVFTKDDIEYLRGMVEIFGCAIEVLKKREAPAQFFNDIREKVIKYAMENESVLITGETGVGKSLVAREIHRLSERKGEFIEFNCASLPPELFESELFGHKKGAFTGAIRDKKGIIEIANGGTLFFDEVAEIPLKLQTKLLRFVETKRYRRIGDEKEYESDVRMIFATNKDLKKEVENKNFREDLYYRISTFIIHLPPLRKRKEMIDYLIKYYSFLLNGKELSKEAVEILRNHKWKGNIREFIQVFKRAGVELNNKVIGKEIICCLSNHLNEETNLIPLKENDSRRITKAINDLNAGMSFWIAVKKPFMERELTKDDVKDIIIRIMNRLDSKKIRDIMRILNLESGEHKKLLDFFNNHGIKIK